jgi:hypothetical protein
MKRFSYDLSRPKRHRIVNCPEIPLEIILENELDKTEDTPFHICEYFQYCVLDPYRLSILPNKTKYAPIFLFLSKLPTEEYNEIVIKVQDFLEFLILKYGITPL